jgi:hypothetical protein
MSKELNIAELHNLAEADMIIKGGKALPIGTKRVHGGVHVEKTAKGWVPEKKGKKGGDGFTINERKVGSKTIYQVIDKDGNVQEEKRTRSAAEKFGESMVRSNAKSAKVAGASKKEESQDEKNHRITLQGIEYRHKDDSIKDAKAIREIVKRNLAYNKETGNKYDIAQNEIRLKAYNEYIANREKKEAPKAATLGKNLSDKDLHSKEAVTNVAKEKSKGGKTHFVNANPLGGKGYVHSTQEDINHMFKVGKPPKELERYHDGKKVSLTEKEVKGNNQVSWLLKNSKKEYNDDHTRYTFSGDLPSGMIDKVKNFYKEHGVDRSGGNKTSMKTIYVGGGSINLETSAYKGNNKVTFSAILSKETAPKAKDPAAKSYPAKAVAKPAKKSSFKSSDTYFETLSGALDQVRTEAKKHGFTVDEDALNLQYGSGGVSYGTTKSATLPLLKDGKPVKSKSGKAMNRNIHVAIYRMDSGRYELTAYKTW